MAELPLDILFDIFSKLSIKSLMRFKCVSKQCSSFISWDPCFATMRMNNQNFEDTQVHLFLLGHRRSRFIEHQNNNGIHVFKVDLNHLADKFYLDTPKYRLKGSCNGVLFFKNYTNRVVLCNPLTQEIAAFECLEWPSRKQEWSARHGIGFDSLSRQYKIVQIFSEKRQVGDRMCFINVAARVSNLEDIGLSWREVKNFPVQYLQERAIYANGCLHWTTNSVPRKIVVSFLLDKEEFISTSLPNDSFFVDVVEIGGFLGAFNLALMGIIKVWVKKELRGDWIKEYEIDFSPKGLAYCYRNRVLGTWKNGELLILNKHENLFSYNKETDALTLVEISGMEFGFDAIIPMRGSIASISKRIQT